MAQESRYLGLLARLGSYRILAGPDGRKVELLDGEGTQILELSEIW